MIQNIQLYFLKIILLIQNKVDLLEFYYEQVLIFFLTSFITFAIVNVLPVSVAPNNT